MYAVYFDNAAVPAIVAATLPQPARDSLPWRIEHMPTGRVIARWQPVPSITLFPSPARRGFSPERHAA